MEIMCNKEICLAYVWGVPLFVYFIVASVACACIALYLSKEKE
jgi:hypothetical protein